MQVMKALFGDGSTALALGDPFESVIEKLGPQHCGWSVISHEYTGQPGEAVPFLTVPLRVTTVRFNSAPTMEESVLKCFLFRNRLFRVSLFFEGEAGAAQLVDQLLRVDGVQPMRDTLNWVWKSPELVVAVFAGARIEVIHTASGVSETTEVHLSDGNRLSVCSGEAYQCVC